MSQISRPFQIALLTMGLFAAVWFVALRGHSTATGGPASSASAPAPATASVTASTPAAASSGGAQAEKSAAPTPVYGGSAPGVAGLSRAIAKAQGAVAQSQQNARQLAEKSAQASSSASVVGGSAPATASPPKSASVTPSSTATPKVSVTAVRPAAPAAKALTGPNKVPARQVQVEQELKQGAVAVVLFWTPKGSDDVAVHQELQLLKAVHERVGSVAKVPEVSRLLKAVGLELNRKIAVQEALPSEVASFGSITRSVHVAGTPTILIINKSGETTTLTGLTDAYAIEQAIDEARRA
jgi:hypothetical protein